MSFPSSPTNGQQAELNGVLYTYNSSLNTWTRTPNINLSVSGNIDANVDVRVVGNVRSSGYYWSNGSPLSTGGGTISVVDETSTNSDFYLAFTGLSSGVLSNVGTSSTRLKWNPSTTVATFGNSVTGGTIAAADDAAFEGLGGNLTLRGGNGFGGDFNGGFRAAIQVGGVARSGSIRGDISIVSGAPTNAGGSGNIYITGRDSYVNGTLGGAIAVTAGTSVGSNTTGGTLSLSAGQGSLLYGSGGDVRINAGNGGTSSDTWGGVGGNIRITAGRGYGPYVGGDIILSGGVSSSSSGGNVSISGGTPITSGAGGNVLVNGANAAGTNQNGGNIIITAGTATGTGTAGEITLSSNVSFSSRIKLSGNAGVSGHVLTSQGNGSAPIWAPAAGGGGGSGDVTGPASATSGNIATFNGTTGKVIQDGGLSLPTSPIVGQTDSQALTNKTYNGLTITSLATGFSAAGGATSKTLTISNTLTFSGTDGSTLNIGSGGTLGSAAYTASTAYAPATTGTAILKGNGTGGFSSAVAGTDYQAAIISTGVLKGNGTGVLSAVADTDYVTPSGSGTLTNKTIAYANNTLTGVQPTLVSGTSIKTVNGSTLLGAGDLVVSAAAGGGSGAVQFNNAGSLDGAGNVDIHNGDLTLTVSTSPTTPTSGNVKIFGKNLANRTMPASVCSSAMDAVIQPSIWRQKTATWKPIGAGATTVPTVEGIAAMSVTGTATGRALAATNLLTRTRRLAYVSAGTAGALATVYNTTAYYTTGDGAGLGGFFMSWRFAITDATAVSGARFFCGISSSVAAPTNVEPNTLTNSIGVAQLSTDATQLYIVYGGSAAQTAIGLGTNFPPMAGTGATNGILYDLTLFSPPNANGVVNYSLERVGTTFVATGTLTPATPGTQTPANNTFMAPRIWRTNNATAAAVGIDIINFYAETDY